MYTSSPIFDPFNPPVLSLRCYGRWQSKLVYRCTPVISPEYMTVLTLNLDMVKIIEIYSNFDIEEIHLV